MSNSVIIGDHIWLGQHCLILKGVFIGSGSIIGACSTVTAKSYQSNSIFAGSPPRLIRENIFFSPACVHNYTKQETEDSKELEDPSAIFTMDSDSLDVFELTANLTGELSSQGKLCILQKLANTTGHNRFTHIKLKDKTTSFTPSLFSKIIRLFSHQ